MAPSFKTASQSCSMRTADQQRSAVRHELPRITCTNACYHCWSPLLCGGCPATGNARQLLGARVTPPFALPSVNHAVVLNMHRRDTKLDLTAELHWEVSTGSLQAGTRRLGKAAGEPSRRTLHHGSHNPKLRQNCNHHVGRHVLPGCMLFTGLSVTCWWRHACTLQRCWQRWLAGLGFAKVAG